MESTLDDRLAQAAPGPRVRRVAPLRTFAWLRAGWNDLRHAARTSLGFGAIVAGAGALLLALAWDALHLAPALTGGFLLVAPCVAVVFYELSRQIERGERIDGRAAALAWRRNADSIALWGMALALTLILWERLAAIIFALLYGGQVADLRSLVIEVLTGQRLELLLAYLAVGGLLALAVFALGWVTAPLLLDRDIDVATAALTSLRGCLRNPGAALAWAAIVAALTAIGFATLMLGMIVLFPWLGHASWHAYRELVE
jgi:uncharacterized membrane protein